MTTDTLWARYARIQDQANSRILSDQAWATDEALDAILDDIAYGRQTIAAARVDYLIANRAAKHRRRRRILVRNRLTGSASADDGIDNLDVWRRLNWCQAQCSDREWRMLVMIGLGHTYAQLAATEKVPEPTVKTWVRRARIKSWRA